MFEEFGNDNIEITPGDDLGCCPLSSFVGRADTDRHPHPTPQSNGRGRPLFHSYACESVSPEARG
jgi:hypothetical protein